MKKLQSLLVTSLLSFFVLSVSFCQTSVNTKSKIIEKGAEVKRVSSDFIFTEGPAVDPEGNVFFTDQPNDKILKWSAENGAISTYMEGASRSNGLYFDNHGNLLSCADLENQLLLIDKNKNVTVLVNAFEGKKLNGPNDLWVDPKGGIYFTDPFYKRDYWTRTEKEIQEENVYYLSPDRKLTMVADGLVRPNGIIGTPDGKKLYVADIDAKKTYSYKINSDGSLSDKTLFVEAGSDGMTIDHKGNVYITGRGVTVFNSKGVKIDQIPVDERWTANVCFGGKDQKTLFITASKSVYTLKMKVRGVR